jgi:hypothetical protein
MKTFGLFLFLWIMSFLASFSIWKDVPTNDLVKFVLTTQIAFIMYKLIKEEEKQ